MMMIEGDKIRRREYLEKPSISLPQMVIPYRMRRSLKTGTKIQDRYLALESVYINSTSVISQLCVSHYTASSSAENKDKDTPSTDLHAPQRDACNGAIRLCVSSGSAELGIFLCTQVVCGVVGG